MTRGDSRPPVACDDAEILRLACLPPLEYSRKREAEAEKLGVSLGALNAEVARTRRALAARAATSKAAKAVAPATPFSILGVAGDEFVYLTAGGALVRLTARSHTSTNLYVLAPRERWAEWFPSGEGGGFNVEAAASWMITAANAEGRFSLDQVRGRGAWLEGPEVVFNAGSHLVIGGAEAAGCTRPLGGVSEAGYVYVAGAPIGLPPDLAPASVKEICPFLEACFMLPIRESEKEALWWTLPGWLACATVGGLLDWRPHLGLFAPTGSGKSYVMERIVRRFLGPFAFYPVGGSTEAGIRQEIGHDALAVVSDEAEPTSDSTSSALLFLARTASSGADSILRGTPSGRAMRFSCRSCFLLASIVPVPVEAADRARFTMLNLYRRTDQTPFIELQARLDGLAPDFFGRVRARILARVSNLRVAAEIFGRAFTAALGDSRAGQQLGTLAAGHWILSSDDCPTPTQADAFAAASASVVREDDKEPDHETALNHLLGTKLRLTATNGFSEERPVSAVLGMAADADPAKEGRAAYAGEVLRDHGLCFNSAGFHVALRHSFLARVFTGTPYAKRWSAVLLQTPGAAYSTFRANGFKCRSVAVPTTWLLTAGEDENTVAPP